MAPAEFTAAPPGDLQHFGDQRGDRRTLAAHQGDGRTAGGLELFDDRGDAVMAADAQVVALGDVMGEHHREPAPSRDSTVSRTLRSSDCASSTITKESCRERPRMWVSGQHLEHSAGLHLFEDRRTGQPPRGCRRRPGPRDPSCRSRCRAGSRALPPTAYSGRKTTTLRWARRSRTASRPAHSARADLPVPALPPRDTMPTDSSSSRSSATRCSAERLRQAEDLTVSTDQLHALVCVDPAQGMRRAAEQPDSGVAGQVSGVGEIDFLGEDRVDVRAEVTSSSVMPVQPDVTTSGAWYSSAGRPTAPALTRSGMSLLHQRDSLALGGEVGGTGRIRASLVPVRKPLGNTEGSVWFNSTCSVPPQSQREWADRAVRARVGGRRRGAAPDGRTSRARGGGAWPPTR